MFTWPLGFVSLSCKLKCFKSLPYVRNDSAGVDQNAETKRNQEFRAAPEQAATLWTAESYHQPQALCFTSKNKGAAKVLSKTQREGAGSGLGAGDTSKLTRVRKSPVVISLTESIGRNSFVPGHQGAPGAPTQSRPLLAQRGVGSLTSSSVLAQECPQSRQTRVSVRGKGQGRGRTERVG